MKTSYISTICTIWNHLNQLNQSGRRRFSSRGFSLKRVSVYVTRKGRGVRNCRRGRSHICENITCVLHHIFSWSLTSCIYYYMTFKVIFFGKSKINATYLLKSSSASSSVSLSSSSLAPPAAPPATVLVSSFSAP